MNFSYQSRSRHSGQALVELALILPVVLLLLLGVIEMGRYFYIGILVGNAARAGAAYGAQGFSKAIPNNPDITAAARNDFSSNGLDPNLLTVTSSNTCGCDVGGTISSDTAGNCTPTTPPTCLGNWTVTIHVTADGSFSGLFSYPGIPSPVAISRTATMRVAKRP